MMTDSSINVIAKGLNERILKEERVICLYRFFLAKKCLNEEFVAFCDDVSREERLLKSKTKGE